MSAAKARIFSCILYPESLPEDWLAKLETLGMPMAISPLHDKDKPDIKSKDGIRKEAERRAKKQCAGILDETDKLVQYEKSKTYWLGVVQAEQLNLPEFKKPHFHAIYVAPNPVTADSVLRKLRRKLGNEAVSYVEIVDSIENYYLYLTHESADAKANKKHVYDKADIKHLNAFDISRYITMDKEQKRDAFIKLVELVYQQNIMNMRQLIAYVQEHGKDIGIDGIGQLISITDTNAWFLRMVFDGNYQEKNLNRAFPKSKTFEEHTKDADSPAGCQAAEESNETFQEYLARHKHSSGTDAADDSPAVEEKPAPLTEGQKRLQMLKLNGWIPEDLGLPDHVLEQMTAKEIREYWLSKQKN